MKRAEALKGQGNALPFFFSPDIPEKNLIARSELDKAHCLGLASP